MQLPSMRRHGATFRDHATFQNQKPGRLAGLFLFWMCRDYFAVRGNVALSNPTELINLCRVAEPGVGPAASSIWPVFARLRRARVGPIFQLLIQPVGRAGRERRSGERVRELVDGSCRRTSPGRYPVSRGDVEHLCHAATSFQICFARAARDCRICPPNGQ